jgi:hypothetical protein
MFAALLIVTMVVACFYLRVSVPFLEVDLVGLLPPHFSQYIVNYGHSLSKAAQYYARGALQTAQDYYELIASSLGWQTVSSGGIPIVPKMKF